MRQPPNAGRSAPPDQPRPPSPRPRLKPRRTNAERTAIARRKLIEAALKTLCEAGYTATTTDLVARRAHVSRGAMLHHFRTRVDLMAAVAEHVITDQSRRRRDEVETFEAGPVRFFEAGDISWEIQKQPATIALLEIMLATRSDPALKKRLSPMVQQLRQMRTEAARRLMSYLSIDDMDLMVDLLRIHLAALRGLALELMFTQTPAEIERARQLLTRYEHTLARELMSKQRANEPHSAANGLANSAAADNALQRDPATEGPRHNQAATHGSGGE